MAEPPPKKANAIPIGTMLAGKYKLTREIGRGGMAAVYEVLNVDIGKRLAVKVLNADLTNSTVVVERFLREARAAAAVNSPYICDVYDAGRLDDGRPYLLLELLEGESLYESMVKVRRFEIPFVARTFAQVARGLTKAHAANIIHRDLKPENIFITRNDEGLTLAKILDFGLAKFYAPLAGDAPQQRLTREGAVFGTPAYMSPEQIKGQGQVDHRADLWATGCMVYECLTGRTVWTTDQGVAMIFAQIATAELPVPSVLRPELPNAFDAWFCRALARDPAKRFQTAREMADELVTVLGHHPRTILISRSSPEAESERSPRVVPLVRTSPVSVEALAPTERPPPSQGGGFGEDEPPTLKFNQRVDALRNTDVSVEPQQGEPRAPTRGWQSWLTMAGAFAVAVGGFVVWDQLIRPQDPPLTSPSVARSAPVPAASTEPAQVLVPVVASVDLPDWARTVMTAQQYIADGKHSDALASFRQAHDSSGNPIPAVLLENARVSTAAEGACKVAALGRPRPFALTSSIRRPEITQTSSGPLVVWADDHEVGGQFQVFGVLLDDALRQRTAPTNLSPEAASAQDPRLLMTDSQLVLLYSDHFGNRPGVFVRPLTASGSILGGTVTVTDSRSATNWPSITVTPSGSFWTVFGEDEEKDPTSRLLVRPLTNSLEPAGDAVMVAELAEKRGLFRSRTRRPSIAFAGNALILTYRVDQGNDHKIVRQRIALNDPLLAKGLPKVQETKTDRFLGDALTLTEGKVRAHYPNAACDPTGCFVVWREDPRAANAAYLDSAAGTMIWRKRFSMAGTQVSVHTDGSGGGLLAWYEAGRVRVAPITRDGIRPSSAIARVTGDQPRPAISKGKGHGEWLLAWIDYEGGHLEAYAAKIRCP